MDIRQRLRHFSSMLLCLLCLASVACDSSGKGERPPSTSEAMRSSKPAAHSPVVREAMRLKLEQDPAVIERLARAREDVLRQALFEYWRRADSRPDALADCVRDHRDRLLPRRHELLAIVPGDADRQEELETIHRTLADGASFAELARAYCRAGADLCGEQGRVGWIELRRWFGPDGLAQCGALPVRTDGQITGPCRTKRGWGLFLVGEAISSKIGLPANPADLPSEIVDQCVRLARAGRLQSLSSSTAPAE